MSKIKLIVGLGNPGPNYANTRHNAGVWWINELSQMYNISFKLQTKLQANIGDFLFQNCKIKVAIPTTYMNNSGDAVGKVAKYFNINPQNILIAHDELDFDPGILRLKTGGGHGGHNGLRDIIPKLGSKEFHRLRIGIGHPKDRNLVSDFVVKTPSKSDRKKIDDSIASSFKAITSILEGNIKSAMNELH